MIFQRNVDKLLTATRQFGLNTGVRGVLKLTFKKLAAAIVIFVIVAAGYLLLPALIQEGAVSEDETASSYDVVEEVGGISDYEVSGDADSSEDIEASSEGSDAVESDAVETEDNSEEVTSIQPLRKLWRTATSTVYASSETPERRDSRSTRQITLNSRTSVQMSIMPPSSPTACRTAS